MGFVKMTCPNCGANFDMNGDLDFGVCNFCGTKIAVDKTIVEHRGTVSVKGVADSDALLDRAQLFIEDGNYSEAKRYCERALDLNPRNYNAYIMKLIAQTECSSREKLASLTKPLDTYDSYQKAIRFAPEEVIKELSDYNQQTISNFKAQKAEWHSELSKLRAVIDSRKAKEKSAKTWIIMETPFIIILVLVFLTVGFLGVPRSSAPLLLSGGLFFLMVGGVIFLEIMQKKGYKYLSENNKMVENYKTKKQEFQEWLNKMQNKIS